jgi:hypothetical protein
MAIYTVVRYKLNTTGRLILSLLVCLGLFQLAEYFVCTQSTVAIFASRFGYAAITLLPPLGLYLMSELTKSMRRKAIVFMFLVAGLLVSYFLFVPNAFSGYECTGNYVIFQIGRSQTGAYTTYYFGLLALSLWKGSRFLRKADKAHKTNRQAVKWLLAGYLIFILPVATLVVVHPDTRAAIPSIMCGFAIGLAVILSAKVAPLKLKIRP